MLTVISNNFGASENDIILMPKQTRYFTVMFGQINVTTTAEEYRRAPFLEVKVQEDFQIGKSREAAAYVIRGDGETNDATITEVFLKDKNTIRVRPIHGYDADGQYTIIMLCLLTPENRKLELAPGTRKRLNFTVTQGSMTGAEFLAVLDSSYVELVFRADTLTFDEGAHYVKVSLQGLLSSIVSCSCPVFFTEDYASQTGSKFYNANINNGVLTIEQGNVTESANASRKFFKVVIPTR